MAAETLPPWVEIPPLAAPPMSPWETLLWALPWLLLSGLLGLALWRWWRRPRARARRRLARIRRTLQHGALEPRQVLFALQRVVAEHPVASGPLPSHLQQQLALRFAAATPDSAQLAALCEELQTWLG